MSMVKTGCFFISLIILFFLNLDGGRPLATPDEGRYVEIPREMALSGDFVTPKLNAMKYFEKPPLLYWIQASIIKALGPDLGTDEGIMRTSIALFGFLGCLFLYLLLKRFTSPEKAVLASAFLGTSGLYYFLSRLIILDMLLTTCVTFAYIAFYIAIHETQPFQKRLWYYGLSVALALGILTKGIVMLALTGPVFIAWLTLTKNWKNLFPLYLPTVLGLFLLIVIPWHYLAHNANVDFLHKYFYVEHFLRYTTKMHGRFQPFWFFIPIVFAACLPWGFRVYDGIKQGIETHKNLTLYLILWSLWIIFFYSLSNSKLIPYILPALPPLAALAALSNKDHQKIGLFLFAGIASIYLFLTILHIFGISLNAIPYPNFGTVLNPSDGEKSFIQFLFVLPLFFITSIVGIFYRPLFFSFISSLILIVLINILAPSIQKTSVKPLAEIINKERHTTDLIVSFESYFQDLPVYTQTAPVICVDAINELEFGMLSEAHLTKKWMLTKDEFIKQFGPKSKKAFWAIARRKNFELFQTLVPTWDLKIKKESQELILFYHSGE